MQRAVKYIVKRSLQHLAARFGRHQRNPENPQLVILMYHRILPGDDMRAVFEEPGMMVTPETFRLHMQLIQQYFEILPLSQWIQKKAEGKPLPPRCCAITFDDGWQDNYEFAYPVLKEYKLPATIFLVSDMIGKNQLFWPERLARVLSFIAENHSDHWQHPCLDWLTTIPSSYTFSDTPPNQEQLSDIINNIKNLSDEDIHQRISTIESELKLDLPAHTSLLNWQQVSEMCENGIFEVGSHTCHHVRLNEKQSREVLNDEIILSQKQINELLGKKVTSFCYPNGDHCPAAVELVSQHYHCAVTTKKGWNDIDTNPHRLNRIGVHEDISADKTAFLACLSGWM